MLDVPRLVLREAGQRRAAPALPGADGRGLHGYLEECRALVLQEIEEIIPHTRHGYRLYELLREYPLRGGKALRPALCIASCRALGGSQSSVLRSAAAIELYHNAFLVHDDIEDRSELRRAEPTLHRKYGVPIAINVGDGMLAVSMSALLGNLDLIGVGKALRVLDTVTRMARESAEGQMIELDWIAQNVWTLDDRSYIRMVYKKTTWYSFITPMRVGVIAAGASATWFDLFGRFALLLGVAFQIQDDVLNLAGNFVDYGKEIAGDLWEGKHTLILIHTIRCATPAERARAIEVLKKERPSVDGGTDAAEPLLDLLALLRREGRVTTAQRLRIVASLHGDQHRTTYKTPADVAFLADLVRRYDGIGYAAQVAKRHAVRAARSLAHLERQLPPSPHVQFLKELVTFVTERSR